MRYFFETEDGQCYPDEDGTELQDLRAACVEASRIMGDFLRERPGEFWETDHLELSVSDERRMKLFSLKLSLAMAPAMNGRHPEV
jgi:hypothetical protein